MIEGRAVPYNSAGDTGAGFVERFAPGAFTESLAKGGAFKRGILALWEHDMSQSLGRTNNGTLELWEDDGGVSFRLRVVDGPRGDQALADVDSKLAEGVSPGFYVEEDEWSKDFSLRTIHKADMLEVSLTAMPVYTDTSVARRSMETAKQEQEKEQRDAITRRLQLRLRAAKVKEGRK